MALSHSFTRSFALMEDPMVGTVVWEEMSWSWHNGNERHSVTF